MGLDSSGYIDVIWVGERGICSLLFRDNIYFRKMVKLVKLFGLSTPELSTDRSYRLIEK